MYQVKISVDEERTVVSFYDDETLLYRTLVSVPYHITEQDLDVQRKKFKEGRCNVPPTIKVWVPGKICVGSWFRQIFNIVDKLVKIMPFRDKEIKYSIHTPYSTHIPRYACKAYKAIEGFKSEEFDPHTLPTRAIKSIITSFGSYPLSASKESLWKIRVKETIKKSKTDKNTVYIKAHYSNWHILVFLADLLKREKYIVKIRPSFTMDKYALEICPLDIDFWIKQEVWASLDIYLQNPKAYQNNCRQKLAKKPESNKTYADMVSLRNQFENIIAWIPHTSLYLPNMDNNPAFYKLQKDALLLADDQVNRLYLFLPNKIKSIYSRFVVDLERYLDNAKEPMSQKGMGYLYNCLIDGTSFDRSVFGNDTHFTEYYKYKHAQLKESIERIGDGAVLLDLHSFNPNPVACDLDQDPNRPDICIGFNEDATKPNKKSLDAITGYLKEQGFVVKYNTPFSGSMTVDTNIKYTSLMIEVNKKCYLSNGNISAEGRKLALHLQQAIKLFIEQMA